MLLFFTAIAWFIFVLYFLYIIGKIYFNREFLVVDDKTKIAELPFLSVIIPARNEESNIERCVTSLVNQSYPGDKYKIIVVDDNSSDNTATIVREIQIGHPNVHLVGAGELPKGWTGKNNACWQGVALAEGEWYCFVDADIVAAPELLETAIGFAVTKQIDMLSINPFQELVSFSERLLLPAVFLAIASSMNFGHVNDPSRPEALANGQFMLFKRKVYEAIEGHYAVRDNIMDDIAFARVVKQSGYLLYWIFGDDLIRTRMYQSYSQIWEGFSKNLVDIIGVRSIITSLLTSLKFLLLGWMPVLLPFWAMYRLSGGDGNLFNFWILSLSILGTAAIFILCIMTVKALKIPFRYGLFFPLGFTIYAFLTANSFWRRKKGGRRWKGRVYE